MVQSESVAGVLHQRLVELALSQAARDEELGGVLLASMKAQVHLAFGYGTFLEYVERLFGYGPRETSERLRVAFALDELPEMTKALREGRLCWSAVRELSRVAVPETERAWLDEAADKTVREIERIVSGREPGDLPDDPVSPGVRRHVLRFEVSAETYATWRDAVAQLRREAGGELDEDAAFLMMARSILGGPKDEGRSSYQVAMMLCSACERGFQQGRGEAVPVGAEVVEMALCDAQHIGEVHTHVGRTEKRKRAAQSIPPATRRLVMRRDGGRCAVPGCRCAVFLDVHHVRGRAEGHDPDSLVVLCGVHHRLLHQGLLVIEGTIANGLRFYHVDGRRYGAAPTDAFVMEAAGRAFSGLRGLGFKESEVKRALREVCTHVGRDASVEDLIRGALNVLTPAQQSTGGRVLNDGRVPRSTA